MAQQVPPLEDVADHYRAAGVLSAVDGRQPIDDVSRALVAAVSDGVGVVRPGSVN
jgi:hypothetical protein